MTSGTDPFPLLHHHRDSAPPYWHDELACWLVTRRDHAGEALADRRLLANDLGGFITRLGRAMGGGLDDVAAVASAVLFLRNPPEHTQERRFLVRVLGGLPLAQLAPLVEQVADELLAPARAQGGMDLVRDYADVLPPMVMARLFGISADLAMELVVLSAGITLLLDGAAPLKFYREMDGNARRARTLLLAALQERRRQPCDDALGRMLALNDAEFGLDDLDIATRAFFLFIAGVETTSAMIGGALRSLLLNPGELARLAHGELTPAEAFDELARYFSPALQTLRQAASDTHIGPQPIRAGERVNILLGAANHDPESYPEPNRLILRRAGPASLTFGTGLHACIGQGLAKLETNVAIARFLTLPPLRPIGTAATWRPIRTQRRLATLPVEFA